MNKLFESYNIGDQVFLADSLINDLKENLYIYHSSNMSKINSNFIFSEDRLNNLFRDLLILNKFPYHAKIIEKRKDVGDGPGFLISISFENKDFKLIVRLLDVH